MSNAKTKKLNKSQPSYILKKKMKRRINALLAEQKRQKEMQKAFQNFLEKEFSGSFADPNYTRSRGSIHSNYYTRKLRR